MDATSSSAVSEGARAQSEEKVVEKSPKDTTESTAEDSKLKGTEDSGSTVKEPDIKMTGESATEGAKKDTTSAKKRKAVDKKEYLDKLEAELLRIHERCEKLKRR